MHLPASLPQSRRPRAFAAPRPRDAARGFTLTELLVVIAIIAMLVALTSVAVVTALGFARQTRVKTEVDALDAAMKAFKEKYGVYPPCDWRGLGTPQMKQFVATAFPRYNLTNLINDLKCTGIDYVNFRPDQALVLWLNGFSNDPQNPFVTIDGYQIANGAVVLNSSMQPVKAPRTPLFDFDPSRLAHVSNSLTPALFDPNTKRPYPSYFPQGSPTDDTGAPYVYFSADTYGVVNPDPPPMAQARRVFNFDDMSAHRLIFTNAGYAVPYGHDLNHNNVFDPEENWVNPDSFQIVSAGSDNKYGATVNAAGMPITRTSPARLYPTGTNYDTSPEAVEDDNVTNFCENARLGDARP
jgi:prepilin-type N-terminal cleavage/methylation domain-containing protein